MTTKSQLTAGELHFAVAARQHLVELALRKASIMALFCTLSLSPGVAAAVNETNVIHSFIARGPKHHWSEPLAKDVTAAFDRIRVGR
jgi:hypothetical protein